MTRILAWLLSLFTFLPTRVLTMMGFGWVTYQAFDDGVNNLVGSALSSLGGMNGTAYSILSLTGFIDAVGILLGAIVARSAFVFIDKFARAVTS